MNAEKDALIAAVQQKREELKQEEGAVVAQARALAVQEDPEPRESRPSMMGIPVGGMYQIQGDEEEENEAAPKPGLFAHFNTKARVALVVAAALFIVLIGVAWKRGTTANTQAAILRTIRKETLEGMDSKEAPIDKLGEKITEKFKAIQERLANSEKSFAKEKAQINTKLLETQQQLQRTQQVAVQIKKELDRVAGQAQQMAQLLRRPEMINKIRAANIRPATITPKDKIAGIKDVPATSEGGWYSKVQGFCSTVANVAANVAAPIKDVTVAAYNKAKDAISPAETPTAKPGDDAIVQPSRAAAPTKPAAGATRPRSRRRRLTPC